MEHLQSKEDSAQGGAEEAPDPEDLAAQVRPVTALHCILLAVSQDGEEKFS